MSRLALWQFNLATFLVTQIMFGVEGWVAWIPAAICAWLTTRNQPSGEKDFRFAAGLWVLIMFFLYMGRTS